ncbi:hypothetical protein ACQKND_04600 [Viridibacillus arvi]|uniref:hypothetical protein n=1 Tax=Viridibacillus arvi TaxID=263475 RepID=UPI003D01CEE7
MHLTVRMAWHDNNWNSLICEDPATNAYCVETHSLLELKPYVLPFKTVTASTLKNQYKKEKKLKLPQLEEIDFQQICYLAWDDPGTH